MKFLKSLILGILFGGVLTYYLYDRYIPPKEKIVEKIKTVEKIKKVKAQCPKQKTILSPKKTCPEKICPKIICPKEKTNKVENKNYLYTHYYPNKHGFLWGKTKENLSFKTYVLENNTKKELAANTFYKAQHQFEIQIYHQNKIIFNRKYNKNIKPKIKHFGAEVKLNDKGYFIELDLKANIDDLNYYYRVHFKDNSQNTFKANHRYLKYYLTNKIPQTVELLIENNNKNIAYKKMDLNLPVIPSPELVNKKYKFHIEKDMDEQLYPRLYWLPVEGAVKYKLTLMKDKANSDSIIKTLYFNHPMAIIKKAKRGNYFWYVSAIDQFGQEGQLSPLGVFHIE